MEEQDVFTRIHCDDVSLYLPVWFITQRSTVLVNFQYIIRSAEEGVAITVFFEPDATDEQKQEIGDQAEKSRRGFRCCLCVGRRGLGGIPAAVFRR